MAQQNGSRQPKKAGQGNNFDINAYRRKKKWIKFRNRFLAFLSVVTLTAAVLVGIYFYQNYDIDQLAQTVKNGSEATVVTDHSFPVAMNGVTPVSLSKVGSGVVLLTKEETIFFNEGGSARYNFNHQYTNPVVKSGGGRLLTYDRGGFGYRIDSENGLHYNARMENTVLTGAIGKKQNYALATTESRYAGSVTVYSKSNKKILHWYSVSDQIVDLSFSDDGNNLAVAAVGFQNGDVSGRVYLLDLDDPGEDALVYTFEGVLPVAVDYKKNGSIHLVCDNSLCMVDRDGLTVSMELSGQPSGYCFTDTDSILMTADTSGLSFSLICFDGEGAERSVQVRGSGLDVAADEGSVYVLEKNTVQRFDSQLELLEQMPITSEIFALEASEGGVYLLSASHLDRWRENDEK